MGNAIDANGGSSDVGKLQHVIIVGAAKAARVPRSQRRDNCGMSSPFQQLLAEFEEIDRADFEHVAVVLLAMAIGMVGVWASRRRELDPHARKPGIGAWKHALWYGLTFSPGDLPAGSVPVDCLRRGKRYVAKAGRAGVSGR